MREQDQAGVGPETLWGALGAAYFSPRRSVRWVLDRKPDFGGLLLLVVTAGVVATLFHFLAFVLLAQDIASAEQVLRARMLEEGFEDADTLSIGVEFSAPVAIADITQTVLLTPLFAAMAWIAASIFGGSADFRDAMTMTAWSSIVLSPAAIVNLSIFTGVVGAGGLPLGAVAAVLYFLFLWCGFFAETFGFRSHWLVFITILGAVFGFGLLVVGLTP